MNNDKLIFADLHDTAFSIFLIFFQQFILNQK